MSPQLVLLAGSLQAKSSNRAALRIVEQAVTTAGTATTVWFDQVAEVSPFNPDTESTPGPAVEAFRAALGACDAVVIATPEYAGSLPGMLKNALDWIVGSGELYGKPVAIISSGTSGGPNARGQLAQTLAFQGASVIAQCGIAAPKTKSDASGEFTDQATIAAITDVVDALLHSLR